MLFFVGFQLKFCIWAYNFFVSSCLICICVLVLFFSVSVTDRVQQMPSNFFLCFYFSSVMYNHTKPFYKQMCERKRRRHNDRRGRKKRLSYLLSDFNCNEIYVMFATPSKVSFAPLPDWWPTRIRKPAGNFVCAMCNHATFMRF